ncbi:GNAT family N-acetyltransferase [Xenorhabdus sp. Flor]|uniref:GNAT family N-acetyltransferase n=1 Tax=Xenorhabdus cabanillasii TaxID=351673 RepID=UPI001992890E|nr:GNAT family N-acetyltransferase [Xenorhabdus sp. Flor]MBD2815593.1 GNAT family N-acetyltransferase [Xenorhabdus sp. Flor]
MIEIREIDRDNLFDICELTSNKDGIGTVMEEYICCNAISIAEAKFFPEFKPKALYHNGILIGFFMYKHMEQKPQEVEICRYMLDYKFIGKGLGRMTFEAMLSYFKETGVKTVILMIDDDNLIAKKLYTSFGFVFTGKVLKEEYYYSLDI